MHWSGDDRDVRTTTAWSDDVWHLLLEGKVSLTLLKILRLRAAPDDAPILLRNKSDEMVNSLTYWEMGVSVASLMAGDTVEGGTSVFSCVKENRGSQEEKGEKEMEARRLSSCSQAGVFFFPPSSEVHFCVLLKFPFGPETVLKIGYTSKGKKGNGRWESGRHSFPRTLRISCLTFGSDSFFPVTPFEWVMS